ncbi:MAG: class I SAM-dependent rRNA methyltransferase [Pseudomonadota bacterium]
MIEQTSAYPLVKMRPNKGWRLSQGAPWIFADEIAMDRRTRKLAPGTLVRLAEGEKPLGVAAFNPDSQIAARILDTDPEAVIDGPWLDARLRAALALRERLFDAPFYRLVHAEGDGLPGLVIDRFGDAVVVQPNAAWADRLIPELTDQLIESTNCQVVIVNGAGRARKLEGLEPRFDVVHGSLAGPVEVPMNGALYLADLEGGQKTGLFFDQRPNHAFVAGVANGARVLDVFTHVGGFGLAALARGAAEVMAVDSSAPALALAEEGAQRMGRADRFSTRKSDAFDALAGLAGETFDLVVCDPPAFAPNKKALDAGLRAYEKVARLAAPLVGFGGTLTLCSCSHAAGTEAFHKACVTGIRKAGRAGALIHSGRAGPDHPVHIGLPETGYLKALTFRLS